METLSITQSLIIALWVAAVMSRWLLGGATLTLRFSPLMTGLVCGIVMGQVKEAMIVTAALQLIYMGVFSPGGTMPSEPCVAAAIAVPVALLGNLDATEAVAIAVTVGLLGVSNDRIVPLICSADLYRLVFRSPIDRDCDLGFRGDGFHSHFAGSRKWFGGHRYRDDDLCDWT